MATGSVRFWSTPGTTWRKWAAAPTNPLVTNAQWEDTLDPAAGPGILWMQCRGVNAVYVSGRSSQEPYKDSLIRKNSRECCRYSTTITGAT